MGVSYQSDEYQQMKEMFIFSIEKEMECDRESAIDLWNILDSIMSDYGAVDWT